MPHDGACGQTRHCWGECFENDPPPRSAYIHVPFCHHHCGYCNFSVIANRDDLIDGFLRAVERELGFLGKPYEIDTLYLGGGTPTLLSEFALRQLYQQLEKWFVSGLSLESSIEANPNDLTPTKIRTLIELGCNRVSIGVQSFQSKKLKLLERTHSADQARLAMEISEPIGNRSLDLIYAVPEETMNDWREDLRIAIELGVDHISIYSLTYEKGARFWGLKNRGILRSVPESLELEMYLSAIEMLNDAGYEQYEISNFAKPGRRSRHNQTYWSDRRWWAFGPGAARFIGNTRSVNHRSVTSYIQKLMNNECPVAERDTLTPAQVALDQLVFGLRQLKGIPWPFPNFRSLPQYEQQVSPIVTEYCHQGWMKLTNGVLKLTQSGLVISDQLWPKILSLGENRLGPRDQCIEFSGSD